MKFRYPKGKTPYGKTVKQKPRPPKPAFEPPLRMGFLTWTLEGGEKFPDDDHMLDKIKSVMKTRKISGEVPEGFTFQADVYFSQVPRIARTLVFRIESWDNGQRSIARIAKSATSEEGEAIYVPVRNPHTWVTREPKEKS